MDCNAISVARTEGVQEGQEVEEGTIIGWWTGSAPFVAKVKMFSASLSPNSFLAATVTW